MYGPGSAVDSHTEEDCQTLNLLRSLILPQAFMGTQNLSAAWPPEFSERSGLPSRVLTGRARLSHLTQGARLVADFKSTDRDNSKKPCATQPP